MNRRVLAALAITVMALAWAGAFYPLQVDEVAADGHLLERTRPFRPVWHWQTPLVPPARPPVGRVVVQIMWGWYFGQLAVVALLGAAGAFFLRTRPPRESAPPPLPGTHPPDVNPM